MNDSNNEYKLPNGNIVPIIDLFRLENCYHSFDLSFPNEYIASIITYRGRIYGMIIENTPYVNDLAKLYGINTLDCPKQIFNKTFDSILNDKFDNLINKDFWDN